MRKPRSLEVQPGLPHHLILRGNNKRRLFSYAPDYRRFLSLITDALPQYGLLLHALVLMSNHLHALVTPGAVHDLAGFVQSIAQRHAQYRNRVRGGTGKVFEQRYIAIPVTDEAYLATLTAYIELNPVRAGRAADPGGYPWSTYGLHAGTLGGAIWPGLWTPTDWYLSLGADYNERARQYAEWVHAIDPRALPAEHLEQIEEVEGRSTLTIARPDWRPTGRRAV